MKVNFTLFIVLFLSISASAANFYWVNGSGVWNDYSNHWATTSGGSTFHNSEPGINDNVFFDENSFPTTGQYLRIQNLDAKCNSMNWEDVENAPRLIFAPSAPIEIHGSLTLHEEMSIESTANIRWKFNSTSPGNTITTGNQHLDEVIFDGQGGGWILQDSLSGNKIDHIEGTFDTNSEAIVVDEFLVGYFNPRTLALRSSVIVCNKKWEAAPSALTFLSGSSTIYTPDFESSALYYYRVFVTTPNTGNSFIRGNGNTFGGLGFQSEAVSEVRGNHTIDGMLSFNKPNTKVLFENNSTITIGDYGSMRTFLPCGGLVHIASLTKGGTVSINKNLGSANISIELKNARLEGIVASGSAPFVAKESIDHGSNSGWSFQNNRTAKTYYWVGGSGKWTEVLHWSLTSGGQGQNCLPSILDNVVFDNNSFSSSNDEVTVEARNVAVHNLDWQATNYNAELNLLGSNNLKSFEISGSLNLSSDADVSDYGTNWIFNSTEQNTINTGGHSLNTMTFSSPYGQWTLENDVKLFSNLNHNAGVLKTVGKNLDVLNFFSGYSEYRGLELGSSKITAVAKIEISESNLFLDAGTSTLKSPRVEAFNIDLYNVTLFSTVGSGTLIGNNLTLNRLKVNTLLPSTIQGSHTYNGDIVINQPGTTTTFTGGSVQTLNGNLNVETDCSTLTTIASTNTNYVTFVKQSGQLVVDYVDFRYVKASGNAFFLAFNSSYFPPNQQPNSGWLFANGACNLPIELASFTATKKHRVVELDWTTESEINGSHFVVERSNNGVDFREIGQVTAVGTSIEIQTYSFLDPNPLNGSNYYRLQMVDLDETFEYSDIQTVEFNYSIEEMIAVYPNPVIDGTKLEIKLTKESGVRIKVVDMRGRIIEEKPMTTMQAGSYILDYDFDHLADGMYFFDVTVDNLQTKRKFIKHGK